MTADRRLALIRTFALGLLLTSFFVMPASAEQQAPSTPASTAGPVETHGTPIAPQDADLSFWANVHVDSLRHNVPPKSRLNVTVKNGSGGWTVKRRNVDSPPKAGKTYKNVNYELNASAKFADPAAAQRAPK